MIIACFILPHGGIQLDPRHFNPTNPTSKQQAWEIHNSCLKVKEEIANLNPEVVFLTTPHGLADLTQFALYLNPKACGHADADCCKCPSCCYDVSIDIDLELTEEIVQTLGPNMKVTGLSGFGQPGHSEEPLPLRWGEVIPLHFIPNITNLKTVILSYPSRRYSKAVEMIPELLSLGSSLYSILEKSKKKIIVVVSGDLAHAHDPTGPYGYSETSEPFDKACGLWASTLQPDALLTTAASLVGQALSCGFTGFVTLQGILQASGLENWKSNLLVNHHPTYYGMMVASLHYQKNS